MICFTHTIVIYIDPARKVCVSPPEKCVDRKQYHLDSWMSGGETGAGVSVLPDISITWPKDGRRSSFALTIVIVGNSQEIIIDDFGCLKKIKNNSVQLLNIESNQK